MTRGKKTLEDLLGHALSDEHFRRRLFANPEATLAAEGYEVTPEVLGVIKNANPDDLESIAAEIGRGADRKVAR